MRELSFSHYLQTRNCNEALLELMLFLKKENVEICEFNRGLSLLAEDARFSPVRTAIRHGLESGGQSLGGLAGGLVGGVAGPIGSALGTVAGMKLGQYASRSLQKNANNIEPSFQQAVQTVNNLSKVLQNPNLANSPAVQNAQQQVSKIKTDLGSLEQNIKNIQQGDTSLGNRFNQIKKPDQRNLIMQKIYSMMKQNPELNQDASLQNAIKQGFEAVGKWADSHPKAARILNLASMVAGEMSGALIS